MPTVHGQEALPFSGISLLLRWVRRDFQVKYTQTALGSLWALAQPIAVTATFVVLFRRLVGVTVGVPYASFVLPGMLIWTLFSAGVMGAISSMANSMFIATKAHYPRVVAPLSGATLPLVDLLAGCLLIPVLFLIQSAPAHLHPLTLLMALVGTLLLSAGLGSLLSALAIFVRDVRNLLPMALQMLVLLTPVGIPQDRLPAVLLLNPMATFVTGFRASLLPTPGPTPTEWIRSLAIAAGAFALGLWYFHRVEHRFADVV